MIRVATLDRQPTARAGVEVVLRAQPDLTHVGSVADRNELAALLDRTHPDVLVLDGMDVCVRVSDRPGAPRVLLFATGFGPHAVVQATLVGAAAIVDKAGPVDALLAALRVLATAERVLPAVSLSQQRSAATLLAPRDRAIFAMRLAGTPAAEIGDVVRLRATEVRTRIAAIAAVLDGVPTPHHDLLPLAA